MNVVTVSPKYQVVIPKEIRERLGIQPGQKIQAFAFEDRVELVQRGFDRQRVNYSEGHRHEHRTGA